MALIYSLESLIFLGIKYLVIVFNIIFCIAGIGTSIVGSVILSDIANYNLFVEVGKIEVPAIILIFIGIITIVIAFLGYFGAKMQKHKMLVIFGITCLNILTMGLVLKIGITVFQPDVSVSLKTTLRNAMNRYTNESDSKVAWDTIQTYFHCCGLNYEEDWKVRLNETLPATCCPYSIGEPCITINGTDVNDGCYKILLGRIKLYTRLLTLVGVGIMFFEYWWPIVLSHLYTFTEI